MSVLSVFGAALPARRGPVPVPRPPLVEPKLCTARTHRVCRACGCCPCCADCQCFACSDPGCRCPDIRYTPEETP